MRGGRSRPCARSHVQSIPLCWSPTSPPLPPLAATSGPQTFTSPGRCPLHPGRTSPLHVGRVLARHVNPGCVLARHSHPPPHYLYTVYHVSVVAVSSPDTRAARDTRSGSSPPPAPPSLAHRFACYADKGPVRPAVPPGSCHHAGTAPVPCASLPSTACRSVPSWIARRL